MWAADCSYVKDLLPPVKFVERMREYIAKALILKIWNKISFGIVAARLDRVGLDGYALEHWIGSHTSLMPCDLSDKDRWHWYHDRNMTDFQLFEGAHHVGTPFQNKRMAFGTIMKDEGQRIKEFYFLAGNILKWYTLYGKVPPKSSWVWSFFPDGEKWENGTATFGEKAVHEVTRPYASSGPVS
jgi:hypothetical protein